MQILTIRNEEELVGAAEVILARMATSGSHVLTLQGDLGAGKTAFTKALAQVLGVTEVVTSPTFVIMKTYPLTGHDPFMSLTHVDAYRIDDEAELQVLGFESILGDETGLVVIEWPERIPNLIPKNALALTIQITEGTERTITYAE